jgi:septum formation inhibitor-activating ATPase MinD
MLRVFVLTNHKGGVGKSMTAMNLAFGLVHLLRQMNAVPCKNPVKRKNTRKSSRVRGLVKS